MARERRVARLAEQIHHRAAEIIAHELKDPRMGFVTVTRVTLDKELERCKVYWSCLGSEKERSLTAHALDHARGYIQREVGRILVTRSIPHLTFEFDESIAGSIKLHNLIDEVNRPVREREDKAKAEAEAAADVVESPPPAAPAPAPDKPTDG
jgi:ribosome-binding factor A